MGAYAQTNVASYAFSKSTGVAYVPITGGTKLFPTATNTTSTYDNEVSAAIPLSSSFNFGGVAMTTCYVSANGYITFGAAPSGSNYTPLSSVGSTTGAISAFGQDGGFSASEPLPPGNHEVRYEDLGTEFVVQWQDHANYSNRSTERLNFQIRLVYATGEIKIVYGDCTDPGTSSSNSPQVGIRGNSNAFATNVSALAIGNVPTGSICDWSKAVTANANNSTMTFSSGTNASIKIPAGLQYSWTPGTLLPVRTFAATTAVTNNGATLSWTAPAGATSYNVQYRIPGSCDWTNYSGNPVSAGTATFTGLVANTSYQVQVQALNDVGQAMYSHIPNLAGTGNGYTTTGSFTTAFMCPSTITGLASSAITPDTSTISWTAPAAPPGSGYEYYYSTSSTAPAITASPSGSVGAGVTTANISGLTPSTQYYYWVRSNCNGTDKGAWSSSANFTTLGLCPTVTAPASNASGVSTTPTITWSVINGATGYKLKIGTTSGGTDIMNNVDVGNVTSHTLSTTLNYSTKYYYTVNAYTPTSTSASCTERSFTTVCAAENLPTISQGFSTLTPECWSVAKGDVTATSTLTYGSSKWVAASGFANTGSNTAVKLNLYGTNSGDWLISQPINLGATPGANRIRYRMAVTSYSGTTAQTTLGTHQVRVIISTDGGTTWSNTNVIKTYTGAGTYSNTGQTETIDLSAYSGNIKIAFVATTASTSPDIYFHIDDFIVEAVPTCIEPNLPVVANVTSTTSDLSWSAPASVPANGYEYYYSINNVVPTAATAASGTSTGTSAPLSNLLPATTYYAWVRSVCSTTNKSIWSSAATFVTNCSATQVYSQNFDTTPVDVLPQCWTSIGSTVGNAKVYAYSSSVASAPNALYIYTSGTSTGMVSTPEFIGLDTNNATISFKGRANFTVGGNVEIGYLTDPADTSTFVVLGTYTASSLSTLDNYSLNIMGVPAGVTKLVLKHTGSPANSVLIDNFVYQLGNLSTSEATVAKNDIKAYPNPFTDVLNISDASKVKSVSIVDASGRLVKTIENPSSELHLADLKQGMYLVVLQMKDGSKQVVKSIKR